MKEKSFKTKVGQKNLKVKMKGWAPQASGACLLQYGETEVLTTAVMSEEEPEGINFLPLTVNYEERYYAAGKIYGSRFIRRETKPTTTATLTARMTDRSIRPRFPENLNREIQVIGTCLSWDDENDPDILVANSASIALMISDIPWGGPVATVRVGRIDNKFVINPTYPEREKSDFDLILSGVEEKKEVLINMIEFEGEETSEKLIEEAIEKAYPALEKLIDLQKKIRREIGKEKISLSEFSDPEIKRETEKFLENKLEKVMFGKDVLKVKEEISALKKELEDYIEEKYPDQDKTKYASSFFKEKQKEILEKSILEKNKRADGRKSEEIRELDSEAGMLERTHGSGIFSRGLTKILSILTLGGPEDYQIVEGMEIVGKKRFIHHYNFPPYSVGEVQYLRAPKRRELGHGALVESALYSLIPDFEEFPYTIRLVSEALSSNGSTSMGSICASSLALMDGGVPIKRPAAGIAIGLIKNDSGNYKILTDIQGAEDALGGMDFKVAGTEKGITAIQLDVKIEGLNQKIIKESLLRAKNARLEILKQIKKTISKPRSSLSSFAPKVLTVKINPEKIGQVIGAKGATINQMSEDYNVSIDIEESGLIYVSGEDKKSCEKAVEQIERITEEPEVGKTYQGKVKNITDYGAFVEILPGEEGLLHISNIVPYRVKDVKNILKEGDVVPVKLTSIDQKGRLDLSAIEAGFQPKKLKKERGNKKNK